MYASTQRSRYRTPNLHRCTIILILISKQKKYLAQLFNISPALAQGVYALLKAPQFEMKEVEKLAETAQEWYKEKKFMPSTMEKLVGKVPSMPIYGV